MKILMQRDYFVIVVTTVLTGLIALSAHVAILSYFEPPAIKTDPYPYLIEVFAFLIRFAIVVGAIVIYLCSKEHWARIKLPYRIILFAMLLMALSEQLFRVPFMGIISGVPWAYQARLTIPVYLGYLTLSSVILLSMPILSKETRFRLLKYAAFAVLAWALVFCVRKISQHTIALLLEPMPALEASKLSQLPWGMNIMVPAYVTFIEPVIASFILFYLIRDKLNAFGALTNGLIIGAILIAIHGGIDSIMLVSSSEGNTFYRLFYYGQFVWEYLILGILTTYSFERFWKKIVH